MDLRFPNPVFYDIEATGFSTDSLPIEIGWAFVGPSREIISNGFLIRPDTTWDLETAWDEIAADPHGIGLEDIQPDGLGPFTIASHMTPPWRAAICFPMHRNLTTIG